MSEISPVASAPPPPVYLSVEAHSLDVEVYVNDIPVLRHSEGSHYRATEAANAWLRPMGNRVRAFGRWPDGVPYNPGQAKLTVDLFVCAPDAEFPTPLRSLANLRWPTPPVPERFPFTLEAEAKQAGFPALKLWTQTERLAEITVVDREQILRETAALRDAVLQKDVEQLMARHALKIEDLATAQAKDPSRLEASLRKQFEWLTALPGLTELKTANAEVTLRLVGEGHAVQVCTPTGQSPLAFVDSDEDTVVGLDPLFGKVNGAWRLLR